MTETVPWDKVARGLMLADRFDLPPVAVAGIDQAAAAVRVKFADYGIDLSRPENVYLALAVLDVLHHGALAGLRQKSLCEHGTQDALTLIKSFEFAIAVSAPAEAHTPTEGTP